jgi:hypothetical protein
MIKTRISLTVPVFRGKRNLSYEVRASDADNKREERDDLKGNRDELLPIKFVDPGKAR